ncbi:hypothetical protein HPB51_024411 [Rhipicephalus microplus]|uniref:Uncharacterized protein n=1 Tax=Rhipicephalus microplus TaxID=6941 RepID=A0A9J6EED7_RHIMP|nr:hypothetical protein HPB51_024411 [Rhipicephalus microplus]
MRKNCIKLHSQSENQDQMTVADILEGNREPLPAGGNHEVTFIFASKWATCRPGGTLDWKIFLAAHVGSNAGLKSKISNVVQVTTSLHNDHSRHYYHGDYNGDGGNNDRGSHTWSIATVGVVPDEWYRSGDNDCCCVCGVFLHRTRETTSFTISWSADDALANLRLSLSLIHKYLSFIQIDFTA